MKLIELKKQVDALIEAGCGESTVFFKTKESEEPKKIDELITFVKVPTKG